MLILHPSTLDDNIIKISSGLFCGKRYCTVGWLFTVLNVPYKDSHLLAIWDVTIYDYRRRAAKFKPMLGAHDLWAERDLYRATHVCYDTGPRFFRSHPKNRPNQVASFDTQWDVEDLLRSPLVASYYTQEGMGDLF
jgi:hypothetical protein